MRRKRLRQHKNRATLTSRLRSRSPNLLSNIRTLGLLKIDVDGSQSGGLANSLTFSACKVHWMRSWTTTRLRQAYKESRRNVLSPLRIVVCILENGFQRVPLPLGVRFCSRRRLTCPVVSAE